MARDRRRAPTETEVTMLRRAAGLAAVLAIALSGGAAAEQSVSLTIASGQASAGLPLQQLITRVFIPEATKRLKEAGVSVAWKEAYAGSLLKPFQVLDGVKDGIAELGVVPVLLFAEKLPLENLNFVLPFVSNDPVLVVRVMRKVHAAIPEMPAQYENFNQVILGGTAGDSYELLTTFRFRTVEDLKGRKIGAPPGILPWLRGTGATGVQSNMMEYYNSAKTGVYDGFIMIASSFPGMKYPEAAPFVTRADFGAIYTVALTINKSVYAKLPEAARKALHEAGALWGEEAAKAQAAAHDVGIASIPGFKAELYELPRAEQVRWAKMMPNIARQWAEGLDRKGLPASKALSMFMTELRAAGAKPARDWDKE
jgi:TRAP-type C4-dicarboxylate transport system substrate-binding protein